MHRTTKPLDPGAVTGDQWSLEVMLMLNGDGSSLLRIARRCATRVMLVGSLALVACGENRNVIELDNGFDVGVGIVRQVPPAPYGNSGPENLGAVLTFDMHVAETDKDCMVREAFELSRRRYRPRDTTGPLRNSMSWRLAATLTSLRCIATVVVTFNDACRQSIPVHDTQGVERRAGERGDLPGPQARLFEQWRALHHDELLANWLLAQETVVERTGLASDKGSRCGQTCLKSTVLHGRRPDLS